MSSVSRLRAWHLALAGIIGQALLFFVNGVFTEVRPFFYPAVAVTFVPVLMMVWPKTRPLGGVLGFLLGIVWAITGVVVLMGLVLVIASAYTVVAETPWGPGPGPVGDEGEWEEDDDNDATDRDDEEDTR